MGVSRSKRYLLVVIMGASLFLAAFGVAMAFTVFQVTRQVPSTFSFIGVEVLSGGDLGLYHDRAGTTPVISLSFKGIDFQPPLRRSVPPETIYIRNESDKELSLIEPCREVVVDGQRIGFMNPQIFDLAGKHRGNVCDSPYLKLVPGEMVKALVDIHDLTPGLATINYSFTAVFGAFNSTGDVPAPVRLELITKWGSQGGGDGQFQSPFGIAVDGSGRVYVTDIINDRVQVFSGDGAFLAKWGTEGPGDGQFNGPRGIAVDPSGRVCVADTNNHRVQVFSGDGAFLGKWGSQGTGDGQLQVPEEIAVDGSGRVYVADTDNLRVQVFDINGNFLVKWGSQVTGNGQFNHRYAIAMDGPRRVYVTDAVNHRVQMFDANGAFLSKWGTFGTGDG